MAKPKRIPTADRIFLYGVNGWGKTSMAAYAPDVAFIEVGTESGYTKLLSGGIVPEVALSGLTPDWPTLVATIDSLQGGDFKTLVIDSVSVAQQLLREHVVAEDFGGDDGKNGFGAFGAGVNAMQTRWVGFLAALDVLWSEGKSIVLIGHSVVKNNKDPEEEDYDQYEPDLMPRLWGSTNSWADAVVFGKMAAFTRTVNKKTTVAANTEPRRMAYFSNTGAVTAKNRHKLPAKINLSESKRPGEPDNDIERAAARLWKGFFNNHAQV